MTAGTLSVPGTLALSSVAALSSALHLWQVRPPQAGSAPARPHKGRVAGVGA